MGQRFSSNNCFGDIDTVYQPQYVSVNTKSNTIKRNSSQYDLDIRYTNDSPLSRRNSFVRFIETTNKDLKICEMCNHIDNSFIQYNQCIDCGHYHCGFHRNITHKHNRRNCY